jgi:hypothetical protein
VPRLANTNGGRFCGTAQRAGVNAQRAGVNARAPV